MINDAPPVNQVPVTLECINHAANAAQISPIIILGILKKEAGMVGSKVRNRNGTFDLGPMQINSIHLNELKKYKIDEQTLRYNGCVNVHIGTWLLKRKTIKYGISWTAIGAYHSETPKHRDKYTADVAQNILGFFKY